MSPVQIPWVLPACISLLGSPLPAGQAWEDAPAFSASPADLLDASGRIPVQARYPVQELLDDYQVSLDDGGRHTARYRYIFRIDSESAIEGWGTVSAGYSTWFEDKPDIRARVITPDGKEHLLDPATIGVFSPGQESPDLFQDRRQLKAPLPRLARGAIAEVEILWRDHRPFSQAGSLGSFSLAQHVPVLHNRFTLEVPRQTPLKWRLAGLPDFKPRIRTIDGRTRVEVDLGRTRPSKKEEPFQAPDQSSHPVLHYSTTPGWEAAAAEYSGLVEAQLKGTQLGPWVRQAAGEATERLEVLKRLVARMHKEVRYTGLEFGEASVVPRTPEDTLKRGYGDCKDKSTLLVALLREAGIPAHLALLRAGSGRDLEPDMPGLSAFNHAIVYVPGPPALWIDPTAPEAPVGELPYADLERRALVIGNPYPGLLTTPGTSPERNLDRETREVFLAEDGPGRIVETSEALGPAEIRLRGGYLGANPRRLRENLKGYVERTYKAKELGRLEYPAPDDLAAPFRLVLEAQKTDIAVTGTTDAVVAANAWPLVEGLSGTLKPGEAEEPDEGDPPAAKAPGKAEAPRRTDLVMPAPYAMEAKWIIHPPPGYAPDALPPDQSLAFGPATLSMVFKAGAGGGVVADYRMACPRKRWTPAEVDQARAALKAFGESRIPRVVLQQVGEAYLGAGKAREALAEFRKARAQAPDSAGPLVRLARAQLAAGLAETARQSLTEALRLDPSSGSALLAQGWVLQHDWIGRRFRPGWDRKGAMEAYRRAIALDPGNRYARQNLAILLEHDALGERYMPGADLDEAVRIYKALLEEEKTDTLQDNLMVCLAKQGHLDEAQEIARIREASPRRNAWMVGLEAILHGQDKAMALGRALFPDLATRRAAYLGAADVAVSFRKYKEASALLDEGATGGSDMAQVKDRAETLARIRPYETFTLDLKDPRDAARSAFLVLGERSLTRKHLEAFMSEAALTPAQFRKAVRAHRKGIANLAAKGMSIPGMLDTALSLGDVTVDGDDRKGYRVQIQRPGRSTSHFYVARSGSTCRVVGDELTDLARQAFWHLKRGELAPARAWLDMLLEDSRKPEEGEPCSGHIIQHVWDKGRQGTAEEIRVACICTLALDKDEEEAFQALLKVLDAKLPPPAMGAVARSATLAAFQRKNMSAMDRASSRLVALYPDSPAARSLRVQSLIASRQWQQALDLVEPSLEKFPDRSDFCTWKLGLLHRMGRTADMESYQADLLARGKATPGHFNSLAWWRVAQGKVDARTLDFARRAVQGTGASSGAAHHTLATVLAESGRTAEALEILLKTLGMREEEDPMGADWYLLGRMAEQLGERAAAEAYYRRVKPDGEWGADEEEDGCTAMAKRRLEALAQGAAPARIPRG